MPTVHLGPTPGADPPVVVPGRVRLELARLVALAQDAAVRLPFDVSAVEAVLADRTEGTAADDARRAWFARLSAQTPSPEDALAGLLAEQVGRVHAAADEPGPEGEAARAAQQEALAVLGRPEALLEVELGLRLGPGAPEPVRAWVAVRGRTAVSLGTVSGADFELAWGAVAALPEMLAHLVRLPAAPPPAEDAEPLAGVPSRFTLPVELLAAVEVGAQRHREDLLPALVERFPRATTGADGEAYDAAATLGLLNTVHDRLTARLRVVVPGVQDDGARLSGAGVVVWMRVDGQWFALDPGLVAGIPVARATAVEPRDLARWVGPVLARVRGKEGDGDG